MFFLFTLKVFTSFLIVFIVDFEQENVSGVGTFASKQSRVTLFLFVRKINRAECFPQLLHVCHYFLIVKSSLVRSGRQTGRFIETTRGFGIESVLSGDVELNLYRPPLIEIKKIVNKLKVIGAWRVNTKPNIAFCIGHQPNGCRKGTLIWNGDKIQAAFLSQN